MPCYATVCLQDYIFENPFYEPPNILVSVGHDNDTSALWMKADGRFSNVLNVWIEVRSFVETYYYHIDCIQPSIFSYFIKTVFRDLYFITFTLQVKRK